MSNSQKFKLIIVGIWAFLVLFFGLMCGISYFDFDNTDCITLIGAISIVLSIVGVGEHITNKDNISYKDGIKPEDQVSLPDPEKED